MNLDHDDECTCDVGPFATCSACQRAAARYQSKSDAQIKKDDQEREYWRKKREREDAAKLSPMDIWNYAREIPMTPANENIDALKAKAEEDQAREVRMFGAPMGQTNTILSLISTITQLRARAGAAEARAEVAETRAEDLDWQQHIIDIGKERNATWNEAIEAALAHAETVCPENTDLHFSIRALKKAPSHE